jgi:hypothetical protein
MVLPRLYKGPSNWWRPNAFPAPVSPYNVVYPANIDYTDAAYGSYSNAALANDAIQGVTLPVYWSVAETTQGSPDFTPIGSAMEAWAGQGKHVSLMLEFATEANGTGSAGNPDNGVLPSWEVSRLGSSNYLVDEDSGYLVVPNYWASGLPSYNGSTTFLGDWMLFVQALGDYLAGTGAYAGSAGSEYVGCLSYIRIGCGLGGESFLVFPTTAPGGGLSANYPTYYSQMGTWATAATGNPLATAWLNMQKSMLNGYQSAMAAAAAQVATGFPVIFPITALVNGSDSPVTNPATGDLISVDVAEYWLGQGGGIGQENMGANGYGSGAGYAGINTILALCGPGNTYPTAWTQIQADNYSGTGGTAADISGIIGAAIGYGLTSIEWYQDQAVNTAFAANAGQPNSMNSYQAWVTSTYG